MIVLLISLSLVRERERGTFERLTMTPVQALGLMVGKMIPYGVLGFLELCIILIVMVAVFAYRSMAALCSYCSCPCPSC